MQDVKDIIKFGRMSVIHSDYKLPLNGLNSFFRYSLVIYDCHVMWRFKFLLEYWYDFFKQRIYENKSSKGLLSFQFPN